MGSGCYNCCSGCLRVWATLSVLGISNTHPCPTFQPVSSDSYSLVPLKSPWHQTHPYHPDPHPLSPGFSLRPSHQYSPLSLSTHHSFHSDWRQDPCAPPHGYLHGLLPVPAFPGVHGPLLPMSRAGSSPTLRSSQSPHPSGYWRKKRRPRSCTMLCCRRKR